VSADGQFTDDNDDLFGAAVQLAARLCRFASAGEIAVSVAVRELSVGNQFRFEDGGLVQLKGLPEPSLPIAWLGATTIVRDHCSDRRVGGI